MRKPSSLSNLKTLPEEPGEREGMISQREIIEWMKQEGNSLKKTVEYLDAEWDIKTHISSLSDFRSWWHLRGDIREADQDSRSVEEAMKETGRYSLEEILQAGQMVFLTRGLKSKDAKTFHAFMDLVLKKRDGETRARQKDESLKQTDRRIKLLEQKAEQADRAKQTMGNGELTMEQKQARLREIFGMQ